MSEAVPGSGAQAGEGAPTPRVRRGFKIGLVATLLTLVVLGAGGVAGLHHTHTNQFCMDCHVEPGAAWARSVHKEVDCRTCHPADLFTEARLGYAAYIERKTIVGEHEPMNTKICARCHIGEGTRYEGKASSKWPEISKTPGHVKHVAEKGLDCLECHVTKLHEYEADVNECIRCHKGKAGGQQFVGSDSLGGSEPKPIATFPAGGVPASVPGGAARAPKGQVAPPAPPKSQEKAPVGRLETAHCLDCHDFLGGREKTLKPTAATCRTCHDPEERLSAASRLAAKSEGAPHAASPHAAPSPAVADAPAGSKAAPRKGDPIWVPKGHEDCLGCHRPHGKPVAYPQDCLQCHDALLAPENRHFRDARLRDCALCHGPHDPRPRKPLEESKGGGK